MLTHPRDLGAQAFGEGLAPRHNPHPRGSRAWKQWNKGWTEAKRKPTPKKETKQ